MKRPNTKPDFAKDFADLVKRVERLERAFGRTDAPAAMPLGLQAPEDTP